jgi:hypothetical protein
MSNNYHSTRQAAAAYGAEASRLQALSRPLLTAHGAAKERRGAPGLLAVVLDEDAREDVRVEGE